MVSTEKSPWSPEDAMELRDKIEEENVHLDHIFQDESSSSGEETSLVGTRIDGFLDAAADMIQRHLRINVDGDDENFDMGEDLEGEEEDEYDGDDDDSEVFDYSVFSKQTVDSISTHHSGGHAASDQPNPPARDKTTDIKDSTVDQSVSEVCQEEKGSKETDVKGTIASDEVSREKVRSADKSSLKESACEEKYSEDDCPIDEKSFEGVRSIRENTSASDTEQKQESSSVLQQKKIVDDGSACSGTSYDEKSFAGLRSFLKVEEVTDEVNNTGDESNTGGNKSAWLPSNDEKSADGKTTTGEHSIQEIDDEASTSGFQSLGMHSTQETTVDEGSVSGYKSLGMHSTQETTIDEGNTTTSRSSSQETTVEEESISGSRSFGLHSTQETTIDEESASVARSSSLHSNQDTSVDGESASMSRSFAHSTQDTTFDEESASASRSYTVYSTQDTTFDEGSTSGSPSFGMHSIQETTIETRSSFGLRPIQECPIERVIDDGNFPKEEGLFGELSTSDKRSRDGKSLASEAHSRGTRSSYSRSHLESTYDEDTRDNSRDSDSAYFTDEYTNYDTTFSQSTMTSKVNRKMKVSQRKQQSSERGKENEKRGGFYVPKKNRDNAKQKPGSNFVDVRDYFIFSDENSIVTQSSFKPPPPRKQTKQSKSRRRMKSSQQQMKIERANRIWEEESFYTEDQTYYTEDQTYCTEDRSYYTEDQTADSDTRISSMHGNSTVLSGSYDDESRSEMTPGHKARLRPICDDVSQITMSVALEPLDESFADTNTLTTHQSHFENNLQPCEERSVNSAGDVNLDTSSIALLSGHSNLDDDQSGKKDSVFGQIRDMGLSIWGKTKEKKEREGAQPKPELSDMDKERLNRARLLDIMKREAKLDEAAWKRIERKQAERKEAELRQPVQNQFEFNRFDLKESYAIKRIDNSFLSQQDGNNSLVELVQYAEDSNSTASNATSDSVLYAREKSQILYNRRMARNIRKSPSKPTVERPAQEALSASASDVGASPSKAFERFAPSNVRASVSDVGVSSLRGHEKSLEGFLTRPASVGQNNVLSTTPVPARASTPRDKLRARMMARSKISAIDAAKVKRDFFAKSHTTTERVRVQVQTPNKPTLKSALKHQGRIGSPTASSPTGILKTSGRVGSPSFLSPTGILKTMDPQRTPKQHNRSAMIPVTSSASKAKRRVSFATPEKFEFVLKEKSEQLSTHPRKGNRQLNDSFDEIVQGRQRSPFQNAKKSSRRIRKSSQAVSRTMYMNQSPNSFPPGTNTSPTSVLDLPSPADSFSNSPRISNLEFLEQQKAKKLTYDDDDSSSDQSSVMMDLSVI